MEERFRRPIFERRIELLREHMERVGTSPGFERELAKAEAVLGEVEPRKE